MGLQETWQNYKKLDIGIVFSDSESFLFLWSKTEVNVVFNQGKILKLRSVSLIAHVTLIYFIFFEFMKEFLKLNQFSSNCICILPRRGGSVG